MNARPRKNNRRFGPARLVLGLFLACLPALPAAVFGEDAPGAKVLLKMKTLLGADQDYFARLRVSEERSVSSGAVEEYFYFTSGGRAASLLYQTAPAAFIGFAYLEKPGMLEGFNPACACASVMGDPAMRERAGFSFAEISPRLLPSEYTPGEEAAENRLPDRSVFTIELVPLKAYERGRRLRLSVSAATGLPLRLAYLDAEGAVERTVEYLAYFEIENKYVPRLVRAADRNGSALLIEASGVSYHPLPDFVFTRAYLEELSR
jgi:hypothetical protein